MKYINADKLIERVKDLKFSTEGIKTVIDLIDELSEEREEQPNPLKVTIKGDGTEEYGKKIIEYFEKLGGINVANIECTKKSSYYFVNIYNEIYWAYEIPKGYTEISLKEDWKIVTDNSKVNTYLLKRVEELEKELIDLKLKLKDLSK